MTFIRYDTLVKPQGSAKTYPPERIRDATKVYQVEGGRLIVTPLIRPFTRVKFKNMGLCFVSPTDSLIPSIGEPDRYTLGMRELQRDRRKYKRPITVIAEIEPGVMSAADPGGVIDLQLQTISAVNAITRDPQWTWNLKLRIQTFFNPIRDLVPELWT